MTTSTRTFSDIPGCKHDCIKFESIECIKELKEHRSFNMTTFLGSCTFKSAYNFDQFLTRYQFKQVSFENQNFVENN